MANAPSGDHCNPERLIALVRSEDATALDHITRCYGERLLAAGRRHCRTTAEAEDAVQDTLLSFSSDLNQFRGEGSLEGFLVRVVARACRRLSRGHKNDRALHDSEAEPAAVGENPEDGAARTELGAALDTLLLTLEARDRALLLLAELEGYSAAEIGKELGLSEGAVRTRLSRLRQRLRVDLAAWL
ncbi:MAG TPA: sigma-70 family RNA polymerase sigma factor [Polyangiaceae bacterium]|nr:sigma-70 family RNA polymerase sigma factor [Polyangiaceae bacterium]